MINGKYMAVVWHVDDLKASHVDSSEIIKFTGYLYIIYRGLTLHRGKVHAYLGMDLEYRKQGVLKVLMINHLYNLSQELPVHLRANADTLSDDHLLNLRYEMEKKYLTEDQAQEGWGSRISDGRR